MRCIQDHVGITLPLELIVDVIVGRQLQVPAKSRVDVQQSVFFISGHSLHGQRPPIQHMSVYYLVQEKKEV